MRVVQLASSIGVEDVPLEAGRQPAVPPEALCQCEPCLDRARATMSARQEAEAEVVTKGNAQVLAALRVVEEVRRRVSQAAEPDPVELVALARAQGHWARSALAAGAAPVGGTPFEVASQVIGLLAPSAAADPMIVEHIADDGTPRQTTGSPAGIVHSETQAQLRGHERFVAHAALLLCVVEPDGGGIREAVVRLSRTFRIRRSA